MTPPWWISVAAVAAGGAIGAICRYGVGLLMLRWHPEAGPLGTLFVNVLGCFLIGLLVPLSDRHAVPPVVALMLVTGFLGAFTTFSTFGYETVFMATTRHRAELALAYVAISLALGLPAVWLGRTLVEWLSR